MNKTKGNVWSFVDLFLLLCVVFLSAAQAQNESEKSKHAVPKILVYLQTAGTGKYVVKCNGRIVNTYELNKIIEQSRKEGVNTVEVYASVDNDIPYGFFSRVKRAVTRPRNKLVVSWEDILMRNVQKSGG